MCFYPCKSYSALQSQKAVTPNFIRKLILPFDFAERYMPMDNTAHNYNTRTKSDTLIRMMFLLEQKKLLWLRNG